MATSNTDHPVEPIASLVEEIVALAEHARLHGAAPDCAARMDAVVERHHARIEAARRIESEAPGVQTDSG